MGDSAKPQQNFGGNGEISNFAPIKILKFQNFEILKV